MKTKCKAVTCGPNDEVRGYATIKYLHENFCLKVDNE